MQLQIQNESMGSILHKMSIAALRAAPPTTRCALNCTLNGVATTPDSLSLCPALIRT